MNKVATLNIEPNLHNRMTDWKRPALEILLKLYKDHPVLYDMRHPKYYNRTERHKALNTIIDLIDDHRPGTTVNDILKKIQVMRTQFGQELGKSKRAQQKGQDYVPTVWWFSYLSFLRHHIKQRSIDRDEDDDYNASMQNSDNDFENYSVEGYEIENDGQSEIVYEIQSSSGAKPEFGHETKVTRKHEPSSPTTLHTTQKEEIIYELTNSNTLVPKRKVEARSPEDPNKRLRRESNTDSNTPFNISSSSKKMEVYEISVEADRARSLGQFVSSQLAAIKDDYLFYSTQMDVLNIINQAQLKQLQMDKEANNTSS